MTATVSSDSDLRSGFSSLSRGGLDQRMFPMRLFTKGNAMFWDPAAIDFSQDAHDWQSLTDDQKRGTTQLVSQFVAGEESVTEDIQPFMRAMAAEGRIADEIYLSQFCFEEAKHTQGFRLWMDAVGLTDDLHSFTYDNPHYRRIFYQEQPATLRALADDPSPINQVRASVTYNHVVEGSLALTGYYAWQKICRENDIFPGMRELIRNISIDERRHMAWGTFTCRRHVAADDSLWEVVGRRMGELLPIVADMIVWNNAQFEESPWGFDDGEFVQYAADRAQRRLGAIESARGRPVAEIDVDYSPETLEDKFGDEDHAVMAG